MKTFYAVVHKDADSAFGVHFPDAVGCFSAADSLDEVLPNASEALSLYFEDAAVPEARGLDAIRSEAAADIAEGAFLLAVPLIRRAFRQVRANISLDKGMLDAIDDAAAKRGVTRSAFLAEAAKNEIEGRH
jgi:predicted RNase H-like HicB family nuclease